jgi:hypothetical protein
MKTRSLFHLTCVCGEQLRSESKTGTCPACKREFRIDWPGDYAPEQPQHKEQSAEAKQTAA